MSLTAPPPHPPGAYHPASSLRVPNSTLAPLISNKPPLTDPATSHSSTSKKRSPFKRFITVIKTKLKLNVPRSISDSHDFEHTPTVFGVPLSQSLQYAGSLVDIKAPGLTRACLPMLITICGQFLSDNGTNTVGIFRVSGSLRRIQEIHQSFDSAPEYGADLDFSRYTVHDVASIFRRYLTLLPEPVIPVADYYLFREALDLSETSSLANQVDAFRKLLANLPEAERLVLLYVISLLGHFARFSEQTRMDIPNLAAIFQPGLLVHPLHTLTPEEYKRSQKVIEFLITHHENFVIPFPSITLLSPPSSGDAGSEVGSVGDSQGAVGDTPAADSVKGLGPSTRSSRKNHYQSTRQPQSHLPRPKSDYILDEEVSPTALAQKLSRAASSPSNATLSTGNMSRVRRGRGIRENINGPPNIRRAVTDYLYNQSRNVSNNGSLGSAGQRTPFQPQPHIAPPPGSSLVPPSGFGPSNRLKRSPKTLYTSVGRGTNVVFSTQPQQIVADGLLEGGGSENRAIPRPARRKGSPWEISSKDPSRPHSQVVLYPVGSNAQLSNSPIPASDANALARSPSADLIREDPMLGANLPQLTPSNDTITPPANFESSRSPQASVTIQVPDSPGDTVPLAFVKARSTITTSDPSPLRPLPLNGPRSYPEEVRLAAAEPAQPKEKSGFTLFGRQVSLYGSMPNPNPASSEAKYTATTPAAEAVESPTASMAPPLITRRLSRDARSTFGQAPSFSTSLLRSDTSQLVDDSLDAHLASTSFTGTNPTDPLHSLTFHPRVPDSHDDPASAK